MPILLVRRATAAQWNARNRVLRRGEVGYNTTDRTLKIGDGVTPWIELDFVRPVLPDQVLFAQKEADTSRASTTTFADDPEVSVPVEANAVYTFSGFTVASAGVVGGLKIRFVGPAGATLTFTTDPGPATAAVGMGVSVNIPGSGADRITPQQGLLETGDTAGNLTLQWAQQVSSITATIMRANTHIALRRIR